MKTCSKCGKWLPTTEFHRRAASKDGLQGWCKACTNQASTSWNRRHPYRERSKVDPRKYRAKELLRNYGLTLAEFDHLWRSCSQRCEVCASPLTEERYGYAVDHDHKTGTVRGLLCHPCNLGLGKFKDDPKILRAAAAYLETRSTRSVKVA